MIKMDIEIKTKDIAEKLDGKRVDVAVLLVRILNEEKCELQRVNEEKSKTIANYEALLNRMLDHVHFCRDCGSIQNTFHYDYVYLYYEICGKQGLCNECEKKERRWMVV